MCLSSAEVSTGNCFKLNQAIPFQTEYWLAGDFSCALGNIREYIFVK